MPAPKVDCTNPDAPAPAPPAPPVVPPAPAPGAPVPKPPTPPPGVPCTTPAFTPRKIPPARVRNMSMLAIGRLYRAMARSRLFSSASRMASLSDKYSLPSRINCPSSGEFVRSGRGTWSAEYALERIVRYRHVKANRRIRLSRSRRGHRDQKPRHSIAREIRPASQILHCFTASYGCKSGFAVSPTIQPSRS